MTCATTNTKTTELGIEWWMVEVARRNARNLSRNGGSSGDMGRTPSRKLKDNFHSILAELAGATFAEDAYGEESVEHVHDWAEPEDVNSSLIEEMNPTAFDLDIFGAAVDVKMRMVWNYPDPDLIVRAGRDGSYKADIYLQVDLHMGDEREMLTDEDGREIPVRVPSKAVIVGFATNVEASVARHYCPHGVYHPTEQTDGTKNWKTMVDRGDLHAVEDIEPWAMMQIESREAGDTVSVTERQDYTDFIATLEENRTDARKTEQTEA